MKYAFMRDHRTRFRASVMCELFGIHRSGYYAWLKAPLSEHARRDHELLELIKHSFEQSGGTYGSPRVHRDLKANGIRCGQKRVARIMKENKLVAHRSYRKPRYKNTKPSQVAPNLLDRQFSVDRPNAAWVPSCQDRERPVVRIIH